jgi:release factor glutamine methyltransferase
VFQDYSHLSEQYFCLVAELASPIHKGIETKELLEDVQKLAAGEAYEYLLGDVDFCGAHVDLSLRPMIPRPETEFWVKEVIKSETVQSRRSSGLKVDTDSNTIKILDLFAGSGCVGLAILKNIPASTVDFVELDPKSKDQIDISIKKNKIDPSRAKVITNDCVVFLATAPSQKYDLITVVPPYVPPQMRDEVMGELHAEDELFFFDKEDGYYFHKQVLSRAKDFLNVGGVLYLEFDITQRERIEQLAKDSGWTSYSFLKDPYGHDCCLYLENV